MTAVDLKRLRRVYPAAKPARCRIEKRTDPKLTEIRKKLMTTRVFAAAFHPFLAVSDRLQVDTN